MDFVHVGVACESSLAAHDSSPITSISNVLTFSDFAEIWFRSEGDTLEYRLVAYSAVSNSSKDIPVVHTNFSSSHLHGIFYLYRQSNVTRTRCRRHILIRSRPRAGENARAHVRAGTLAPTCGRERSRPRAGGNARAHENRRITAPLLKQKCNCSFNYRKLPSYSARTDFFPTGSLLVHTSTRPAYWMARSTRPECQ